MLNRFRLMATIVEKQIKDKWDMQKFLNQNGGIAVVDFHATWCGPCKTIAPYVQKQCEANNLPLIKIDVDQANQLATQFSISSMPTFLVVFLQYDNILIKKVGGSEATVDQIIEKAVTYKRSKPE